MKKTALTCPTEVEIQQGLIEDFNGESHAYTGSIKATVVELQKVNAGIEAEIKATNALIEKYEANVANMLEMKAENERVIAEITKVFEGVK